MDDVKIKTVSSAQGAGNLKEAMFGAGCFWGVQYNFDHPVRSLARDKVASPKDLGEATSNGKKGVIETEVGYAGGHTENPTYKDVCADKTGHAEVVHLIYDNAVISYEELLKSFWENHDPTALNRQGPDRGSQYRSIIFCYDEEQKELAEKTKKELNESKKHMNPVVTEIVPAGEFYKAEEYHQKYFEKTGQKVCH